MLRAIGLEKIISFKGRSEFSICNAKGWSHGGAAAENTEAEVVVTDVEDPGREVRMESAR